MLPAEENGLPIVEMSPTSTHLGAQAAATIPTAPGAAPAIARAFATKTKPTGVTDQVWETAIASLALAGEDGEGLVVVIGRGSVAESSQVVSEAVGVLAEAFPAACFLPALRRGNVLGALDMGLAPGILPGRVHPRRRKGLVRRRARMVIAARWDRARREGILGALADGSMKAVVLVRC